MGVAAVGGEDYERGEGGFEGAVEESEGLEVEHVYLSTSVYSFMPYYGSSYLVDEQHTRD